MSIELLQMRTIQGQIYDIGTIPSEYVFDKMSDMCTTINLNLDRMIMFELNDCRMGETPPGYIMVRGSEVSMIWHTPYFPAEVDE